MRRMLKKYRVLVTVFVLLIGLVVFSAAASGVHRGHRKTAVSVVESASDMPQGHTETVAEILSGSGIKNVDLPVTYFSACKDLVSVKTESCKKYIQCMVLTKTGKIEVREYRYANLIEDEVLKIPAHADKFCWNNKDVFIFENQDVSVSAVYYSGLTRYIITENLTKSELADKF